MPWRCPACGIPIQHLDAELTPRPKVHYRCHVCRLELVLNEDGNKLTVPPLDDKSDDPKR